MYVAHLNSESDVIQAVQKVVGTLSLDAARHEVSSISISLKPDRGRGRIHATATATVKIKGYATIGMEV